MSDNELTEEETQEIVRRAGARMEKESYDGPALDALIDLLVELSELPGVPMCERHRLDAAMDTAYQRVFSILCAEEESALLEEKIADSAN